MSENPKYLEIASQMLDMDVEELQKQYPQLVDKLNRINTKILKVKPYGFYQSTQAIGAVIDQYFVENELASRIAELENKTSRLDDFGRPSENWDN